MEIFCVVVNHFLIGFSPLNVPTKQVLLSTNEIFHLLDSEHYLSHFGERVESSFFLSEKSIIDLIASFSFLSCL
jgi:hypothetical protein